jgi:hypothetical protein
MPRCSNEFVRGRLVGGVAGAFGAFILLGCMNFAVGNHCSEAPEGILEQKGEVHLRPMDEQDVYYPVAYASIPNVELSANYHLVVIEEQKEDHFRIRNTSTSIVSTGWHARGVRAGLLPPPSQPLVKASGSELPSEPVPAH